MPRSPKKIIQDEMAAVEVQLRVAAARKEVAKAELKLKEAKANLAQIEKEAKGGK